MANFSIRQALGASWGSAKKHWPVWLLASFIYTVTSLPQQIVDFPSQEFSGKGSVWALVGGLLLLLFTPGMTQNGLVAARKGSPTNNLLIQRINLTGKFLIFYLLYMLIVGLGLILLIIPGLYFAVRYVLTPYILLDNPKMGVAEAMQLSTSLTKGKILRLIGALFIVGIISAVGLLLVMLIFTPFIDPTTNITNLLIINAISLIAGVFTIPFSIVGGASVYDQIKSKHTTIEA